MKLSKVSDGKEVTLDIRQAGDLIGLNVLPIGRDLPRDGHLPRRDGGRGLTRHGFEGLVVDHPSVGLQVIRNLSERLAGLGERVESMAVGNLEERLFLSVLLQVAREHGVVRRDGVALSSPSRTHPDSEVIVSAHRVDMAGSQQ